MPKPGFSLVLLKIFFFLQLTVMCEKFRELRCIGEKIYLYKFQGCR